jgi:hypothetical protein
LEPVFQSLLDNATRLCAADFGLMAKYDGSSFQLMAQLGGNQDYVEYLQREPFRPRSETLTGRVLQARGPVQIEDFAKSKGYLDRDPLVVVAVEKGGVRTTLGVPMLRENELIGVISLYRKEVRLFTDKQIELYRTSPPKLSSPSRTRGCSMSYANHYSSRPRPPTRSRSSAARRSIYKWCSIPWSNLPRTFVVQTWRSSVGVKARPTD